MAPSLETYYYISPVRRNLRLTNAKKFPESQLNVEVRFQPRLRPFLEVVTLQLTLKA